MPAVAVITEYNPFHFGHMHQISELKKHFDTVVCIMSGFAVQRGGIALFDKYSRARAAVDCGASLVVELPFPCSCASASDFASAGVDIASRICVDALAFGAEDDIQPFFNVCEMRQSGVLQQKTKAYLDAGARSYPTALCMAVKDTVGDDAAEMLKKPNNILACEYIYYARRNNLAIFPLKRDMSFKSAGEIRALQEGDLFNELPQKSAYALKSGNTIDKNRFDAFVFSRLYDRLPNITKDGVYAATDDALHKLRSHIASCNDIERLALECADAGHTAAYYRRLICSVAFDITPSMPKQTACETFLLAADGRGRRHLSKINRAGDIKIITKPADAADARTKKALDIEAAVSRICMCPPFDPYKARPYIKQETVQEDIQ